MNYRTDNEACAAMEELQATSIALKKRVGQNSVLKSCVEGDFLGGTVVKNPPANAGDTGLSPGPGRSHMPWSS